MNTNRVLVIDKNLHALMPCHPARARQLLTAGRAAVFRMQPFTIILKDRTVETSTVQPIEFKTDPGSKTTGIAMVVEGATGRRVVWAANLEHRGNAIKARLDSRRALRSGRRSRHCRYRQARFLNRTKPRGWLPPSLMHRVQTVQTWLIRLSRYAPIATIEIETVRFDMQKIQNPEISGTEYQQGKLAGYEVREYLLEKWDRKCAYCGAQNIPLEIEHIRARANGGTDRVSNLTIACHACNNAKGTLPIETFLKDKPEVLRRIQGQAKASLKDAAAVNATRYAIGNALKSTGLPTGFWSGGRTKRNRVSQHYPKDHWIDAACVGTTGEQVFIPEDHRALHIKATGHGNRQMCRTDKFGFPRTAPKAVKRVAGFQTGDLVRLDCTSGKYKGVWTGRLSAIRARGYITLKTPIGVADRPAREFTLLQHADGYEYA